MKIVYVPGFLEGREQLPILRYVLAKHKVIYFDYDTSLKETIPKLAMQLKYFINNLKLEATEKIALIGYSAGSTIAEYYLKFIDSKKVSKFILVCSPIEGTFLANIFPKNRKGLQQVKPKSKFLADLAKKKLPGVKKTSFYCPFDIITPGTPVKHENSVKTFYFLHVFAPCWPTIILKIRKLLE
jgi:pimeloyl-ACP methyl ester carboxylesterase